MNQHIKSYKLRKISKTVASVAFGVFFSVTFAYASPTGGQIISGSGSISQTGNTTTISQNSGVLDINWDTFNINSNETVNFDQVNSSAIAINRIQDINPSQINGTLTANGRVFLINNAGITFGAGAHVNVGSLIATTSDIIDFNGDDFTFSGGENNSKVQNFGNINIADGGFAVLSAPHVVNQGTINAKDGLIALGSATEFSLNIAGHNVNFLANNATAGIIGVDTAGNLSAQGGAIVIKAKQAADLAATMINLDGNINVSAYEAGGTVGSIDIFSEGNLDAKSSLLAQANAHTTGNGGNALFIAEKTAVFRDGAQIEIKGGHLSGKGGFTEFSGYERLHVLGSGFDASGANGVGVVLFDPQDITVASGGGAAYSDVDLFSDNAGLDMTIDAATITAINADIILEATQDIFINQDIDHSANVGRSITLHAGRHITMQVGTTITTNNGDVTLHADYNYSGSGGPANDNIGDITVYDINTNGGQFSALAGTGTINFQSDVTANADIYIRTYNGTVNIANGATIDATGAHLQIYNTGTSSLIQVNESGRLTADTMDLDSYQIRDNNATNFVNFIATTSLSLHGESRGQNKPGLSVYNGHPTEFTILIDTPVVTLDSGLFSSRHSSLTNMAADWTLTSTSTQTKLGHIRAMGNLTMNLENQNYGDFALQVEAVGDLTINSNTTTTAKYLILRAERIFMSANTALKGDNFEISSNHTELGYLNTKNLEFNSAGSGITFNNPVVIDANGPAYNISMGSNTYATFTQGTIGTALDPLETSLDYIILNNGWFPVSVYLNELNAIRFYQAGSWTSSSNLHIIAGGNITSDNHINFTDGSIYLEQTAGDFVAPQVTTTTGDITLISANNLDITNAITTTSGNITLSGNDIINFDQALTTTGNVSLASTDLTFGASSSINADKVILDVSNDLTLQDVTATSTDSDAILIQNAASITDSQDGNADLISQNGGLTIKDVGSTGVTVHIDSAELTLDTVSGDATVKNEQDFNMGTSTMDGNLTLETATGDPLDFNDPAAVAIRDNITFTDGSGLTVDGADILTPPPPPPPVVENQGSSSDATKDKVQEVVNQVQRPASNNRLDPSLDNNSGFTPNNNATNNQSSTAEVVRKEDKLSIGSIEIDIKEAKVSNLSNQETLVKLLLDILPDKVLNLADLTAYLAQAQRKKL